MENKKLAIVGVTGMVGQVVLEILASKSIIPDINPDNLLFVASDKSVGKVITFLDKDIKVISVLDALNAKPDYVIMSAGASISKEVAPKFVQNGAIVIDNSSAWRTYKEIPLIVPSIPNPTLNLEMKSGIIANPNCVAIMIAIAISPFVDKGIDMVLASVMQSVSGAGYKGVNTLAEELKNNDGVKASMSTFVSNIANNIIPASAMSATLPKYNDEEAKMMFEVPKILDKSIKFSAQSCRVPVARGHSAMIRVFFNEEQQESTLIELLKIAPQIKYTEEPLGPYDTVGKDYVIVRSFRQDINNKKAFEFFVASDNLRVGAAYNAVAILGKLLGVYKEKNYS